MRIEEIRLENLTAIIREDFAGNKAALARALKKKPDYISRWFSKHEKHHRNISGSSARIIENITGRSRGWMDQRHSRVSTNAIDTAIDASTEGTNEISPPAYYADPNPQHDAEQLAEHLTKRIKIAVNESKLSKDQIKILGDIFDQFTLEKSQ